MKILFRESEVKRVQTLLHRGASVVLHGSAGVGKHSVFQEAALRSRAAVVVVDIMELVQKSSSLSELKELFEEQVEQAAARRAVLYVPRIELLKTIEDGCCTSLFAQTEEFCPRLLQSLCERVGRGDLQCVATTTAYDSMLRRVSMFFALFEDLKVNELSADKVTAALSANQIELSAVMGRRIDRNAIACAVKLTDKYFPHQQLPAKAIELIEDVCATETRCSAPAVVLRVAEVTSLEATELSEEVAFTMKRPSASRPMGGRPPVVPMLSIATGCASLELGFDMPPASPTLGV